MEGHMDVLTQSAKDLQELEALDSPPSCSPSWSLAQRLLSCCPNMKYCLETHVTLMEELGAIPPPSHSWMAPLVEDCCVMLELDSPKQWWQAQVGHLEIVVLTTQHHPVGPLEARNIIGIRETKGLNHLSSLHLPQMVGSRATGVHYQHPWYCPGLTSQIDQDIPDKVDGIKRKEPAWR